MSLDIVAFDPKEVKARKDKFKAKYGISYDKFDDEMIKPRKDMFCYYLHPELLESDIKKYEEMDDDAELIADVDEVDSFHIGYGHFIFLRKELGELVGIRYDDSDVFNTRIYYDDCYKNTSLLNFFHILIVMVNLALMKFKSPMSNLLSIAIKKCYVRKKLANGQKK